MPADIARVRLQRSGLSGRPFEHPREVVEAHLAMQSQDFGPAKWSIGQRLASLTSDEDVERAVSRGDILRTHVLRQTWHFVAARDLIWLMALSGPRVQRGLAGRYRQLGLDPKTRGKAERVVARALQGDNHQIRAELREVLRKSRIDTEGQRLPHILSHCELEGIVCSGRVKGKHQTYALVEERVRRPRRLDSDVAVVELVRRYLSSHGPATVKDMRWWSGLTIAELRNGLDGLGDKVKGKEVNGVTLWSLRNGLRSAGGKRAVLLLQTYDETVIGYTESRYFGDPRAKTTREAFVARNLPTGVALLDARVIGLWRRGTKERTVDIEVLLYEDLAPRDTRLLEAAATELGRFTARQPRLQVDLLR